MTCFRTPVHVGGCAAPRFGRAAHLGHRGALVGYSLSPRERRTKTTVAYSTCAPPSNACGVGGTHAWKCGAKHFPETVQHRQRTCGRNRKFGTGAAVFLWKAPPKRNPRFPAARVLRKTHAVFQPGWSPPCRERLGETNRRATHVWPKLTAPTLRRRGRLGCRRPTSPVQPPASHGTHGTPVPSWLA